MSRYPLQTVTLPVLIDAETPENADGWATRFPDSGHTAFTAVRAVTGAEIKKRLAQIFSSKEVSPTNEKFLYVGADLLRRAYESKDKLTLADALKKVEPWVPRLSGRVNRNVDWEGARWDYSSLMSNAVQNARLVVWWQPNKGERLMSPGLYCPNWRTAAYVMMVMGGIRVCPKCGNLFVPKADNQGYCSPAHGVAYRTARSRWKAKYAKGKRRE